MFCGLVFPTEAREAALRTASEYDYPPLAMVDQAGKPYGFSIDVLDALSAEIGLPFHIETAPWADILIRFRSGELDFLPLVAWSAERAEAFDLTIPYLREHATLFVRSTTVGHRDLRLEDFHQKRILVMKDDIAHEQIRLALPDAPLTTFNSLEEALKALADGTGDAVVANRLAGVLLLKMLNLKGIEPLGPTIEGFAQKWCMAVPKGNSALLATLNEGLALLQANGTLRELEEKWLSPPERALISRETRQIIFLLSLGCLGLLALLFGVHRYMQAVIKRKTHQLADIARRLDEQLRFQRSLLEALPIPVFIKDTKLHYIGANQSFTKLFQKRLQEVIGKRAADLTSEEFAATYEAKDRELLAQGGTQTYAFKVNDADGVERHFVFHKALFDRSDGSHGGIVGAMLDVTEEKKARAQLEASESRFRLLAENATDIILLNDTTGRTLYVSPAVREVLGYEPEEFVHREPEDFMLSADRAIPRQALPELLQKGQTRFDLRLHHRQGGIVHVEVIATLLDAEAPDSAPRRVLNVIRDITRRKEEERHMRNAVRQAEEASRAKSEFLALMSHEIRTPMNGILGMAQILQIRLQDPEALSMIDTILSCGNHLTHVIDQILSLSRIEAGSLEIEQTAFSLRPFLSELASAHRAPIESKGLSFALEIASQCEDRFIGDPVRLRQIIDNLLSNAAKFTPSGEISLEVKAMAPEEGRQTLLITVADTGIGIAQKDQVRLFQPFTQVDASSSRCYEGTGLGLVISKRLAKLMGGDITLRSEPERGSRFTVVISLHVVSNNDGSFAHNFPSAPGANHLEIQSLQLQDKFEGRDPVLLVEDSEINAFVTQEMLGEIGVPSHRAATGAAALDYLAGHQPPLVLVDLQMPEMDGFAVLREIRRLHPHCPHLRVVALTAHSQPEDQERCAQAGFDAFLAKPVSIRQLYDILQPPQRG